MQATDGLTEVQWQVTDAIARSLVLDHADVNELQKAIAYLRAYRDRDDAGKQFFSYLKTLVRHGDRIGHSKKTAGYYATIERVCEQYLRAYQDDTPMILQILGWAARLMQYYDKAGPIGEIPAAKIQSEREAEIQAVTSAQSFAVGQKLETQVKSIKGNKVTYEILGAIRLTQKEPKQVKSLTEGQTVMVEIVDLKEDGSIRKIKLNG